MKKNRDFSRFLCYNTIIKIESGANKNPTIETLAKIAKALRVGVDNLINLNIMKEKINKILNLINSWKVILAVFLIIAGLFYWYQIRPAYIYSYCNYKAKEDAKESLRIKVEIGADVYKDAVEKELHLKDDYEYAYKKCLREKGINK